MVSGESLEAGISLLADAGLNLFAAFSVERLPAGIVDTIDLPEVHQSLVLIGHGGCHLWQQMQRREALTGKDPVDRHTIKRVQEFAQSTLGGAPIAIHYPGDSPIGLQRLGDLAGWHHPSPMGIGINNKWGLWYAYRAVFTTTAILPETDQRSESHSPCTQCARTPCINTCPAGATHLEKGLHLEKCSTYRLLDDSPCAERCIAREACPASADARYSDDQINYHYRQSLQTLKTITPRVC